MAGPGSMPPTPTPCPSRPRVSSSTSRTWNTNSTGIVLIVGLLAKARAANRPVLACGLSEHYQEIFTITRLSDFMSIFPDEASARSGATPTPAG